jgi:site-specific DNA-methyltransferase (adenine-specific)
LQNYAKPGQKILDTHGGSMSIAIACDIEGFDLDLCELDKDYFEAGKKRLERTKHSPACSTHRRHNPRNN